MGDNIRLKGPLGLKQDIYDDKRAKEFKKLFQLTPKEFIAEYDKKLLEEKKQEKDGGYMKVKKLLPGGLLNKSIRMVVAAGQKAKNQKKLGEMTQENKKLIEFSKELAQQTTGGYKDKLGPEVINDLARQMARTEKTGKYANILQKVQNDPRFADQKKDITVSVNNLREYGKKLLDQTKAIIDKDIQKPKLNKDGGFIDMTKDKKYWKGVL